MARVGEEVEGLDIDEAVSLVAEQAEVADLGGGVAGDIDEAGRAKGGELLDELLSAAFAGWVDDDCGLVGWGIDPGEDRFGGGRKEGGIGDAVGGGVLARPFAGGFGHFDSADGLEAVGEGEGEEAGAAVGIDEVVSAAFCGTVGDITGEQREDERVVLEEVSGDELEAEGTHLFFGGGFEVGEDAIPGGADEDGGAAAERLGLGAYFIADARQGLVDRIHGDVAIWDVDKH